MQGAIARGFSKRKRYDNRKINYTKHVLPTNNDSITQNIADSRYFLLIVFQFEGYLPEWGGTFKYKRVNKHGLEYPGTYLKKEITTQLGWVK